MKLRILILFLLGIIPLSKVSGTDLTEFQYFHKLDSNIQVMIVSYLPDTIDQMLICKSVTKKLREVRAWASTDAHLANKINMAVVDGVMVNDSALVKELRSPSAFMLIKRLLGFSANSNDAVLRGKIKYILVQHIRPKVFFYNDKIIEWGRAKPNYRRHALEILRICLPEGSPLIHSTKLPEQYRQNLNRAVKLMLFHVNDSVLNFWRFPRELNLRMLRTAHFPGEEEHVISAHPNN